MLKKLARFAVGCGIMGMAALAQMQPPAKDITLTASERDKAIDSLVEQLNKSYVFPEKAKSVEEALRAHQKAKDYDKITSGIEFARTLTSHLAAVCHDGHLRVVLRPADMLKRSGDGPSPIEIEEMHRVGSFMNFGFERVERLPGNIGYIDLHGFSPAKWGADTASAAMNLLANTDCLIFDLRENGGGDPEMVQYICTYLFDEPVHLNDLYFRPSGETRQFWTLPHVPGKLYGGKKPVYVLTSHFTFSGAEEFTYNLKNLKRATIIGETTGGGAHPGDLRPISDHLLAFIPTGRAINPVTKTDWEGTGVEPDVKVPAGQALKTAQIMALQVQVDHVSDPDLKERIRKTMEDIKKELEELKKQPANPAHRP